MAELVNLYSYGIRTHLYVCSEVPVENNLAQLNNSQAALLHVACLHLIIVNQSRNLLFALFIND